MLFERFRGGSFPGFEPNPTVPYPKPATYEGQKIMREAEVAPMDPGKFAVAKVQIARPQPFEMGAEDATLFERPFVATAPNPITAIHHRIIQPKPFHGNKVGKRL